MADSIGFDTQYLSGSSSTKGDEGARAGPSKQMMSHAEQTDFSSSLTHWRDIQLPTVQNDLEKLVPTLMEAQKDALLSRKKLAEQTREFKKLTNDAQPEAVKPLLRAYQAEIDSLTKRAKAAETAVLSVRDRLHGASDPYPILELVLEQTAVMGDVEQLKEQVKKLQMANTTLETQVATLPSIEAERARLASRIAHLQSSASETRKTIEAELSAKWDERIRNSRSREEDLQKSLETTQAQLKDVRANYVKATERLLHHGEAVEREQTKGNMEELDMIGEELSRSNERAAAMERRNEQLRQEIERLKSGLGEDQRVVELERRVFDAEEESRRLNKLLEDEARKNKADAEQREAKVREVEANVREKDREIESLRKKVKGMANYEEIKRELEIIKLVEFAAESETFDDDGESKQVSDGEGTKTIAKPLEALLIEKNRHLQDELTSLRVAHNELQTSTLTTIQELESAKDEASRLKKLNERLEDDLLNVKPGQTKVVNANDSGMSAEDALAEMDKIEKGTGGASANGGGAPPIASSKGISNAASLFEEAGKATQATSTSATGTSSPAISSTASNILPIITSQRDRFRARNAELEEELRKQFSTITELRSEVKTLQSDNLGLYEKVRYLQTYSATAAGGNAVGLRGPAGSIGGSRLVNMAAARNDFSGGSAHAYPPSSSTMSGEDKYREKYEASMNPFERFRGTEQSRAINNLNPLERILHMLTRVVLGHRRMRIFFVIYAVCLHLLVFAMLFEVEFATGTPAPLLGTNPVGQGPGT